LSQNSDLEDRSLEVSPFESITVQSRPPSRTPTPELTPAPAPTLTPAPIPTPSLFKMKPPKPSSYDPTGSNPEALEFWLDQMESYFVLAETQETEHNEKVLVAFFYLAGTARDWYRIDKVNLTS